MISPVVIGGFAVLDGAVLGQFAYAVAQYRRNHDQGSGEAQDDSSRRARAGARLPRR